MISSKQIREQFINFFKEKKHKVSRSAPVIPIDDPTLLFTNAGMNQFKNIFLGLKKPEFSRVVDSQKCIRAGGKHNDLEEVGRDGYHHTFFEMLGNWSFADYYKKEAIIWAWHLLTKIWKLPKTKLYATVYKDDSEAYDLWKNETDIDPNHIEFHGEKDNFWEMGETGPCGPCSEIHFDRGKTFCDLKDEKHECKVNGDCHRYIELWNLVFIQYNRDEKGKLNKLPHRYVDTGAGFERICQILQKKNSNYETDLFSPIIKQVVKLSGKEYSLGKEGTSHRIIADHIRSLSFALADGGMPSNEGRGYVLRRILRRAARHGRLLDLKKAFLYKLVDTVIEIMGDHFSELKEKKAHIKLIIKAEEERFNLTLDNGLQRFKQIIRKLEGDKIKGSDVFLLYDTFGFPPDLTKLMAEENGLSVDMKDFRKEMKKQKARARKASKFNTNESLIEKLQVDKSLNTEFVGYAKQNIKAKVLNYFIDDRNNVILVLNKTPFYAESGGQIADIGKIYNEECEIEIRDVQKENNIYFHFGKLITGEINHRLYTATVNQTFRKNVARNHTATHLLHKALKDVLGEHVNQKGSLVNQDHLRFDFTHFKKVRDRELSMVENEVNRQVRACLPVHTQYQNIDRAKKNGAVALFGEKYDERVRVVSMGKFSKELCGGTHLDYTGEIGFFKITSESSIAAGIRRIEAITGEKSERYVKILENEIDEIGAQLNAPESAILEKLRKVLSENKQLHVRLKKIKVQSAGSSLDQLMKNAKIINGVKLVAAKIDIQNPNMLRQLGDQLKNKIKSGIGVLAAENNGKVSLIAIVTKDLTDKYKAGDIIGKIAKIVGGGGGGRPDMALAGGKDISKIDKALAEVPKIIQNT